MKCLIITYNPISGETNFGKTLKALFSKFSKDELMQLYVRPCSVSEYVCCTSYRLCEKDIIKNFNPFNKSGEISKIEPVMQTAEYTKNPKITLNPFFKIARELIWVFGRKNMKAIYKWIEREKPDCIFACGGDYNFLFNLEMKISKKYNLPMVACFGDDFYSIDTSNFSLLERLKFKSLKKKIKQFVNNCSSIICICDVLTNHYRKEFNCKADTLYIGANMPVSIDAVMNESQTLSYLGNISLGRYECLYEIGKALTQINNKCNTNFKLNIYTPRVLYPEALELFNREECIEFKGAVKGEEVEKIIKSSLAVVHTESFRNENIAQTKYSLSTKVSDSLASGVPFIVYGPSGIGATEYVRDNDCALLIDNPKDLVVKLEKFLLDENLRKYYAKKGIMVANINHNSEKNSIKLRQILQEVCVENTANK